MKDTIHAGTHTGTHTHKLAKKDQIEEEGPLQRIKNNLEITTNKEYSYS